MLTLSTQQRSYTGKLLGSRQADMLLYIELKTRIRLLLMLWKHKYLTAMPFHSTSFTTHIVRYLRLNFLVEPFLNAISLHFVEIKPQWTVFLFAGRSAFSHDWFNSSFPLPSYLTNVFDTMKIQCSTIVTKLLDIDEWKISETRHCS